MDIPKEFLSKEFLSQFKTGEDVTGSMEQNPQSTCQQISNKETQSV
ncbi:hypothetical protein [Phocaeicola sartorii]|nr:hypothetical protein [Phocaeicola sartorii]